MPRRLIPRYDISIPWIQLREHILTLRDQALLDTVNAIGMQKVGQAQGRAQAFSLLLNLPETLRILEQTVDEVTGAAESY